MELLLAVGFKYLDQLVATPALQATKRHHPLALALLPRPFQHSSKLLQIAMRLSPPLKHFCASQVPLHLMALDSAACSKLTTFLGLAGHRTFLQCLAAALPPTLPGTLAFLRSIAMLSWALP